MGKDYPKELTGVKYVVWVQIEKCDYDKDKFENVMEDVEVGRFNTHKEALAFVKKLTN